MSGQRGHCFNGNLAGESRCHIDPPLLPTPAPQQAQGGTPISGNDNTVIGVGDVSGGSTVIIIVPPSQPPPAAA